MPVRLRLAACLCVAVAGPAAAQESAHEAAHDLALRRIMLSQSGVGYFEYAAQVDGAGVLTLDLHRDQVSDALMSLVVLDPSGSVARVELPGESGIGAALAQLPVPRESLDKPLDLLNALQGQVVTVSGPNPMIGRILHAEPPPELSGGGPVQALDPRLGKTRVTLLTDTGLQQFVLEDAASVQVADPALRAKLDDALAALRGAAVSDTRRLSVHVAGTAAREVRVGLVLGAPLWKITYRLLVPQQSGGTARLQGWAILENAGLTDWHAVQLSVQSGNPVAFRQDVYRMYMIDRPEVPVDMLARTLPPLDTRALPMARAMAAPAPAGAFAAAMPEAAPPPPPMAAPEEPAQAEEGAADTVFTLPQPLDLSAGHTAAVPILDHAVAARRVGLLAPFQAHPTESVQLTNDTGTLLPPGAVTTYDAIGFTGDARVGALPQGEMRLLGFATDAATTADWHSHAATNILGIAAARGVLRVTRRERTTTEVDINAPAGRTRDLLVEIPRRADATLTTEPAVSGITQTAGDWRVPLSLKAGQTLHLVANADRPLSQSIVLTPGNMGPLVALLNEQGLPAAAHDALERLVTLRQHVADREADRHRIATEQAAVEADEARLRQNLAAVPDGDALHARLMQGLAADEDRLAQLREQAQAADAAVRQAQDALGQAVGALAF